MEDRCFPSRRVIAQGPICTVEECACGVLHMTLGVLTLRLQAEVIASLRDTLDEALEQLVSPGRGTRSAPGEASAYARSPLDRPS